MGSRMAEEVRWGWGWGCWVAKVVLGAVGTRLTFSGFTTSYNTSKRFFSMCDIIWMVKENVFRSSKWSWSDQGGAEEEDVWVQEKEHLEVQLGCRRFRTKEVGHRSTQ